MATTIAGFQEVNSWDGRERSIKLKQARITCAICGKEGNPKIKERRVQGKRHYGLYCASCGRWQMWISVRSDYYVEFVRLREEQQGES